MNRKQGGFSVVEVAIVIVLLIVLGAVGLYVYQKHQNGNLSETEINKKFDCGRITADFRFTDVFCNNPKFYNNPDSVTYEDYYKYQACAERLKGEPPAESAKTNDPGFYNAYYDCKNPDKLDNLRLQFIQELKKLKAQNS